MIEEEMMELYALKNIIRFNNLSRITNESVAEHSFFVSLIVARLHKTYQFNLEKALLMAITHDIFEIWVSDIPRNIKDKYKELDEVATKIENNIIKEKYPEYKELLNDFNNKRTVEGLIVKLADALSVMQYTNTEIGLGNNLYMPRVKRETRKAIARLYTELKGAQK